MINGEKWFSSFASMASFIIVMAMTDPDAPPYQRYSMFVVPADTPGINVLRDVGLGLPAARRRSRGLCPLRERPGARGSHAWTAGRCVRGRPDPAGRRANPPRHAHRRPGRRIFDMICERAVSRYTQGEMLADKQMVQEMIADSWMEIEAFRLLTLQTAWKIDQYNDYKAGSRGHLGGQGDDAEGASRRVGTGAADPRVAGHLRTRCRSSYLVESFVLGLADGPTEVHKVTLARLLLKDQSRRPTCSRRSTCFGCGRRRRRSSPTSLRGFLVSCDGKVALVTGTSRGLGKAIAQRLAARRRDGRAHRAHHGARPQISRLASADARRDRSRRRHGDRDPGRFVQGRRPRAAVRRGGRTRWRTRHSGQQRRRHVPAAARRVSREAGAADDGDARAGAAAPHPAGDPRHARTRPRLGTERDVGRRRAARRARRSPTSIAPRASASTARSRRRSTG